MQYDLGDIDLEQKTLQPLDNPFGKRMSPMSPAGIDRNFLVPAVGIEERGYVAIYGPMYPRLYPRLNWVIPTNGPRGSLAPCYYEAA
jgi:hypothetical protein